YNRLVRRLDRAYSPRPFALLQILRRCRRLVWRGPLALALEDIPVPFRDKLPNSMRLERFEGDLRRYVILAAASGKNDHQQADAHRAGCDRIGQPQPVL